MAVLLNNIQEKISLSQEQLTLLEKIIDRGLARFQKEAAEVSLVLTNDDYIQELNLEYRGKDQPTDVLSFALQEEAEGISEIMNDEDEDIPELLGDIYISIERAVEQANSYGHSLERELGYLAVHGLLHLLGYDHQEPDQTAAMREMEETIMTEFDLGRSTP